MSEVADGLTGAEARRRLERLGPNDVGPARPVASTARQILAAFGNPLILLLLMAGSVSAVLGQVVNASLIASMVLLSVSLNLVQTFRSQSAMDRLRREVAPTAEVRRDGRWTRIPRRDVVAGDVVRLAAGDLVPADAGLLRAKDLHVQEASLTGESLPVEKVAGDPVFLGTSVVSGTAEAAVSATGRSTRFGEIAARLAARPPETEFERGTRRFGYLILRTVLFLVLFVLLVNLVLHRNPLESLLFAVALAVGLTPEFLPMITSVTLARGAVRMGRLKVIVKHLEAIQNFGSIDVLCTDKTGTLTSGTLSLQTCCDFAGRDAARVLALARTNSALQSGLQSPLDTALLASEGPAPAGTKIDEIPFDFERRRLSVVVEQNERRRMITKGAPESILPICGFRDGDAGGVAALDEDGRGRAEALCRSFAEKGLRVLAVAWKDVAPKPAYGSSDEAGLVLAGFAVFSDPVKPDARKTVERLRRDGVEIKIVTGDDGRVARHVADQVGLGSGEFLLGTDIDAMTDPALSVAAERSSVFARVSPAQKSRILLALKRRGHVVGFLGDGINDAPSLHAADVGISVASAVDVAREAAEIILLDEDLRALHQGILEGRKSFGNVMKYLLMGTSSNFGNMLSMAAASAFLPFLPMLPTQILLNNFLYDLAQVTIPTDRVDATFVRKPQRWRIDVIRRFMIAIGPISSVFDFVTFWLLLTAFRSSAAFFHTGWFVESIATQALVLFVIRTAGNPFRSRPSPLLAGTTVGVVVLAAVLPYTPAAEPLGFVSLPGRFFAYLLPLVGAYLVCVEAVKRRIFGGRPAEGLRPGGAVGASDATTPD